MTFRRVQAAVHTLWTELLQSHGPDWCCSGSCSLMHKQQSCKQQGRHQRLTIHGAAAIDAHKAVSERLHGLQQNHGHHMCMLASSAQPAARYMCATRRSKTHPRRRWQASDRGAVWGAAACAGATCLALWSAPMAAGVTPAHADIRLWSVECSLKDCL